MERRDLLKLVGAGALARLSSGCDNLVLLGEDRANGIPPITPNDEFYVYACCGQPDVDEATFETAITHDGVELARLSRDFLRSLPAREREHTLECIGARPRIQNISNAIWTGLPLAEVFEAAGVEVPATAVGFRITGADDYHAGLPLSDLLDAPLWLVWEMNGEPLSPEHGAPARLLVPGRYGVKNLKWIRELAFVDTPHVSYWTTRGWSEEANYKPNTFVVSPLEGTSVKAGDLVRFLGTAFAGLDPVVAVEVSIDGGPWEPAVLDYETGEDSIWVLWSFDWKGESGEHVLQARCTTASGVVSDPNPDGTDQFQGYDGSMLIAFTVTA